VFARGALAVVLAGDQQAAVVVPGALGERVVDAAEG